MYTIEELQKMTVAQLRKYAREQGIELPAGFVKADIVEKIHSSQPAGIEQSAPPAPVRRAVIIADDSDDVPVMTVNSRPRPQEDSRPAVSAPRPSAPLPKGNKPPFTLAGARAWHNPQPFTAQNMPAGRYAPQQQTQPINMTLNSRQGMTDARPVQRTPVYTRFGPESQNKPEESPQATQQRHYMAMVDKALGRVGEAAVRAPKEAEETPVAPAASLAPAAVPQNQPTRPRDPAPFPEVMAAGDMGEGEGVLEIMPDGYGFIRAGNYLPGDDDVYISNAQVRRFNLRNGDLVKGKTRPKRDMDRYSAMLYITHLNGVEVDERAERRDFDTLQCQYPVKKIKIADRTHPNTLLRCISLFAPIGFGQRAMLSVPEGTSATDILLSIADSACDNYPDMAVLLLLVGAMPEEVSYVKQRTRAETLHASFDMAPDNGSRVSEMVMCRARRLAETGKDVLVLIDDFAALTQTYAAMHQGDCWLNPSQATLTRACRLLGNARSIKDGGSVTVLAAVTRRDTPFDGAVLENVRRVVNCCVSLEDGLCGGKAGLSVSGSFTMHDDNLLTHDENEMVKRLRPIMASRSDKESMEMILSMMEKTTTNRELTGRFDTWYAMLTGGEGGLK